MAKKMSFRLSGTGGQGVIKAAVILAEAGLLDGFNATQSQVYGPESRGSATRAEVKISDEDILFPKVLIPDVLLCLSQTAFDKFSPDISENSIVVVDDSIDTSRFTAGAKLISKPIISSTRESMGSELSVNIVSLGVLNAMIGAVSDDAMESSLKRNFSAKAVPQNIDAYYLGKKIAK